MSLRPDWPPDWTAVLPKRNLRALLAPALLFIALACSRAPAPAVVTGGKLRLATTTSAKDSGLLAVLLDAFFAATGIEVEVTATGTGAALQRGRDGLADVLLTHDRAGEEQLVHDGYGLNRCDVMYNEFVIVGPVGDPLALRDSSNVVEVLRRIVANGGPWLSRGDDSGTHRRELALWRLLGESPTGAGVAKSGAGMQATLRLASDRGAYVLSDESTFLANADELQLIVVCAGDARLHNDYAVTVINPAKTPGADFARAMRFVDFLASASAHRLISGFGVERFGRALFTPHR